MGLLVTLTKLDLCCNTATQQGLLVNTKTTMEKSNFVALAVWLLQDRTAYKNEIEFCSETLKLFTKYNSSINLIHVIHVKNKLKVAATLFLVTPSLLPCCLQLDHSLTPS